MPIQSKAEKISSGILVTITGTIDEATDFTKAVPSVDSHLQIDCFGITRINSMGVKKWMKHFGDLHEQNRKFSFIRVSPALVEQLNIVKNFACGGAVESVVLPYICTTTNESYPLVVETKILKQAGFNTEGTTCEKCSDPLEFDEIPEEYLAFVKNGI
jgi:anti-anti-sigma regulatory factor